MVFLLFPTQFIFETPIDKRLLLLKPLLIRWINVIKFKLLHVHHEKKIT